MRFSRWSRELQRFVKLSLFLFLFTSSKAFADAPFAIFPYHYAGMFSCYSVVVGMLDAYDLNEFSGMEVNFNGSGFYLDPQRGNNWWEYFFEPMTLGSKEGKEIKYIKEGLIGDMAMRGFVRIRLARCKELVDKYIRVKKEILDEVDTFVGKNFRDTYVIGIHFRGTDQRPERTATPTYEEINELVEKALKEKKTARYKIFVATDEQPFLDFMKEKHKERVCYFEMKRSDPKSPPLHFDTALSGYEKGKTALVDCLTLARCHAFIGSSSNFTAAVLVNNPHLPTFIAGSDYKKDELVPLFPAGS